MSKIAFTVSLKKTRMGWCVYVNHEPYAVGSHAYCQDVSKRLILQQLQQSLEALPHQFIAQKGGVA